MLHIHAQFDDKLVSVEVPGIQDMLIRMQLGRFKVFKHLADWFEEFRLYHRKDGRVHKEGDDLMSATRYALMMLRHARTAAALRSFTRRLTHEDYPPPRDCVRGKGRPLRAATMHHSSSSASRPSRMSKISSQISWRSRSSFSRGVTGSRGSGCISTVSSH